MSRFKVVHGQTAGGSCTPTYTSWRSMKHRCLSKRGETYRRYAARGITVCDRWLNSFENFLADMGERPSPEHSIDRINNDGNYEPGNCRWATAEEQGLNMSCTKIFEHEGQRMGMKAWARKLGIDPSTMRARIKNWPPERAFSEPKNMGSK